MGSEERNLVISTAILLLFIDVITGMMIFALASLAGFGEIVACIMGGLLLSLNLYFGYSVWYCLREGRKTENEWEDNGEDDY